MARSQHSPDRVAVDPRCIVDYDRLRIKAGDLGCIDIDTHETWTEKSRPCIEFSTCGFIEHACQCTNNKIAMLSFRTAFIPQWRPAGDGLDGVRPSIGEVAQGRRAPPNQGTAGGRAAMARCQNGSAVRPSVMVALAKRHGYRYNMKLDTVACVSFNV